MRSIASDREQAPSLRRGLGWFLPNLVGAGLLFVWVWSISVAYDFGLADESWFLQVLTRVVGGDVLYRDVFFGATPLSVYLAAPLVAVFGSEIVVVKAFVSFCFVLTVLICGAILRSLGNSRRSIALLLLALIAYGWPRQSAGYTPLAYTCLVSCLAAILGWRARIVAKQSDAGSVEQLALAGGFAGLCFASKQNLGIYAFVALTATVLLTLLAARAGWRKAGYAALLSCVAGVLVVCVTLLPVVLSGGIPQFLDFGFTNKRTYLRTAGISYLDGLRALTRYVQAVRSFDEMRWVYQQTLFLLPPLALVTLLLAWVVSKPPQRGHLGTIGVFAGAGLLGVYPRADVDHVIYAVPAVLLSLVYAGSTLAERLRRHGRHVLHISLVFWFALGIALIGSGALRRVVSPDYERSTLPHFRGVWLTKHEHTALHRYTAALQEASAAERPFLLTPYAAFTYLVTGLENPTPFDYPLITAFGRNGAADLMRAIEQGRIRSVCMARDSRFPFTPHELRQFVSAHMEAVTDLEFCTVYRTRSRRPRWLDTERLSGGDWRSGLSGTLRGVVAVNRPIAQ